VTTNRIVIVGAGAAGVFTAYRIREMYGDAYEVLLFEANDRVGGNTMSATVEYGGKPYNIDCGAQFFYKNPQPSYTALVDQLGLMDSASEVISAPAGFLVWDKQANDQRLWLPSRVIEFLQYDAADWGRLSEFLIYLAYSAELDRSNPSWTLSIDDWLKTLHLLSDDFKEKVIKPFVYQFVSLPYSRIGESSALYATTYFVRNLFGEPGTPDVDTDPPDLPGLPTFQTYQSMIGLDGILKRALEAAGVTPKLKTPVLAVRPDSSGAGGALHVTTKDGVLQADHVVFACDPHKAADIIEAGTSVGGVSTLLPLVTNLRGLEYIPLTIRMQKDGSCWMPPDSDDWEPANTIVDGDDLTFSVWFGRLRPTYGLGKRIPVFKSWGAPNLGPCQHQLLEHSHFIPLPTTTFMALREGLKAWQGTNGMWFAGGWTNWFDSQEAALDSATAIAEALPLPAKPATGAARMIKVQPEAIERNLRRFAERVARKAPKDLQQGLTDVLERVKGEG
jgi:predicted NAD/FAD-binding protein